MKNFDEELAERDSLDARTFQLHGQQFIRRVAVRPERLFDYQPRLAEAKSSRETFEIVDEYMLLLIEDADDAHNRYRALRADDENALSSRSLLTVLGWLFDEFTSVPTAARSSSGNGRATTGSGSTGKSSSTAAAA